MTFSYDLSSGFSDLTRVRFHIGDTDANAPMFTDGEINALIVEKGSYQSAALACVKNLIAKLSATPSFQADWLRVDTATAVANYKALLSELQREFGVAVVATGLTVYRQDSNQTTAPDYGNDNDE